VSELINPFEESNDWDGCCSQIVARVDKDDRMKSISRNDWYRLRRLLEVILSSLKPVEREILISKLKSSDLDSATAANTTRNIISGKRIFTLNMFDVRCFFLCEERVQLYRTIDSRCLDMITAGLLEEVTDLIINNRLKTNTMGARAIGYRQSIQYLSAEDWENNSEAAFFKFLKYTFNFVISSF
jgi:tRNA dimethylallyltransferase